MTTVAQNTKIWSVIEAVEMLIVCTEPKATQAELGDARGALFEALREFLLPAIRVIDCAPQGESENIVECRTCQAKAPCKLHCPGWAASIRSEVVDFDTSSNEVGGKDGSVA